MIWEQVSPLPRGQNARHWADKTDFDAEITAIEEALKLFRTSPFLHIIIHSDSTSAIARAGQTGAGPGQQRAKKIQSMVVHLPQHYQSAEIT
jgi:ribonuclease HI